MIFLPIIQFQRALKPKFGFTNRGSLSVFTKLLSIQLWTLPKWGSCICKLRVMCTFCGYAAYCDEPFGIWIGRREALHMSWCEPGPKRNRGPVNQEAAFIGDDFTFLDVNVSCLGRCQRMVRVNIWSQVKIDISVKFWPQILLSASQL